MNLQVEQKTEKMLTDAKGKSRKLSSIGKVGRDILKNRLLFQENVVF